MLINATHVEGLGPEMELSICNAIPLADLELWADSLAEAAVDAQPHTRYADGFVITNGMISREIARTCAARQTPSPLPSVDLVIGINAQSTMFA
jgi:hypothetical protein